MSEGCGSKKSLSRSHAATKEMELSKKDVAELSFCSVIL